MNLNPLIDQFLLWVLILIRVVSAVAVMPVLGYRGVPNTIKVGLAAFIALVMVPIVQPPLFWAGAASNIWTILALVFTEILAGVVMGMVTHFIFYGIQLSGQYLGIQIGFAIANVLDPQTETQISIIAQLQFIFAMLIFIIIDGHHFLISGIQSSFKIVPIGGVQLPSELSALFVKLMGDMFVAGVKISAPVMGALFLSEVALGIVARTVPQMNIFIVGFPLKIGIGLLTMALSWPLFIYILKLLWQNFQNDWMKLIMLLGP